MRHLKKGRKFGRRRNQRRALIKALATAFFLHGRIRTTEAKARELRPIVEKHLTRAKNPTLANRRILGRTFADRIVKKAIETAQPYLERRGGYTRITKLGSRKSDSAKMAILELVK